MTHSSANIGGMLGREGGYAVRHRHTPVPNFCHLRNGPSSSSDSELQSGNLSADTFFWLYPYGEGGIEADRTVSVTMAEHVWCSIQEHSGLFAIDQTWGYVQFAILQKRQAFLAANLQVKRKDWDRIFALFYTLSAEDLSAAAAESACGEPPSDAWVVLLRNMVNTAGGKVMGSDASRTANWSEISSTALTLNPPTLWVTINPTGLHDPIVQIFAGESIDMDQFSATAGPSGEMQACSLAKNPYATARFFNFMILAILETLFGIRAREHKVVSTMGVLQDVSSYYGV
jgi:hypothetical protein